MSEGIEHVTQFARVITG